MEDFEKTYRRLKAGLEKAYVEWRTPVFNSMDRQESRDAFYEVIETQLLRARALYNIGDENGVRVILRRVAKVLPTVKLNTPQKG